ncbi:F-box protein CPR1-like isoform X1 [Apium graveolens]|uniref:F-box protein CPR1-like isoform X1 n=2 Tax=Apium graveolens TaxID=4045 RepID=UPI003D7C0C82
MNPSQSNSTASSPAQTLGPGKLNGTLHCPIESVFEILLRLPVKPLLRCRCVCKPWCSLIDSKKFVDKHLQRNIESNPDSGIIFRAYTEGNNFYMADVDSLNDSTVMELADPLKTQLYGAVFVGSCNGVVCLWKDETDVLLWNPATRKVRVLPIPNNIPIPFMLMQSDAVGFGYDHLSEDYKVVRFVDSQLQGIMVSVYSLKSNTWTRAETITNTIRLRMNFGIFANGALYWLAAKGAHIILAFDLGVERHTELPLPAGVNKTEENRMGLIVFNRCVCLIDHYPDSHTDIWMKNENGVDNSWSKFLAVEQPGILGSFKIVWPVAFSQTRNNILLAVDGDKFTWYDSERNEVKKVIIQGLPGSYASLVYTESLVHFSYDFKLELEDLLKVYIYMCNFISMVTNFRL